ncbi:MAG: imidazoleglycerol-phosphate dehydratase HisB [Deltaproteobacteria bacterium]|nr:imidazoleglycerol-phosphate dehydratase HisB [Deltaproteobacteria bacterium]
MKKKPGRKAKVERKTKETDISLKFSLDGEGKSDINSGIAFLDHMLTLFAAHGFFDLVLRARGDIEVDFHHTVEDIGICLGDALREALGERQGIRRYGQAIVPMDEALCQVAIDISNRPLLVYNVKMRQSKVGMFDTQLVPEFLQALATHGGITLHVNVMYGRNAHHIIEAVFKALGRALDMAASLDGRVSGVISTKGLI